jgi:hypothetical protein
MKAQIRAAIEIATSIGLIIGRASRGDGAEDYRQLNATTA